MILPLETSAISATSANREAPKSSTESLRQFYKCVEKIVRQLEDSRIIGEYPDYGTLTGQVVFCAGYEMVEADEERTVRVDSEIGTLASQAFLVDYSSYFNELKGQQVENRKYRTHLVLTLNRTLETKFEEIIRAVPTDYLSRVIVWNGQLTIHIYDDLEDKERNQLRTPIQPLPGGIIHFSQGEWVLVDGSDQNHLLGSLSRSQDGCRYWMLIDPVHKRVAATHLDLASDMEVIHEMAGALARLGSNLKELQLFSSPNAPGNIQQELQRTFASAEYELGSDVFCDAQAATFTKATDEQRKLMQADPTVDSRPADNSEIRQAHAIPHVLAYCSPSLREKLGVV